MLLLFHPSSLSVNTISQNKIERGDKWRRNVNEVKTAFDKHFLPHSHSYSHSRSVSQSKFPLIVY